MLRKCTGKHPRCQPLLFTSLLGQAICFYSDLAAVDHDAVLRELPSELGYGLLIIRDRQRKTVPVAPFRKRVSGIIAETVPVPYLSVLIDEAELRRTYCFRICGFKVIFVKINVINHDPQRTVVEYVLSRERAFLHLIFGHRSVIGP